MNRPQTKDNPPMSLVPAMVCAFFALWLCVSTASADDFGLTNPVEKEFDIPKSATRTTGTLAKKSPILHDRTLPTHQKTETIRQVSSVNDDPFPQVPQPSVVQVPSPYDWETVPPASPNMPFVDQSNVMIPYDPNVAGGYVDPYAGMQNMYPAGMTGLTGLEMGGGSFTPFAQYPQQPQYPLQYPLQYQQGTMPGDINSYMNPYANMYAQYGNVADPYAMGYQRESQAMPDYSPSYQAFMLHEMARRQTEESQKFPKPQDKANNDNDAEEAKKQADANWTLNNLVPLRVTSPLGETLMVAAQTISPFNTPAGPDKGVGMPLVNKSWLDHPYYLGGFVGSMCGSELVSKMIEQKSGGTGGVIFGYNFNDYWGLESRLHVASIDIHDTDYAKQLIEDIYPGIVVLPTTRTNKLTMLDVSAHYYPLGNAKWRPYFKYGLGIGRQQFTDTFGYGQSADIITMPLGIGMRYWWNERIAIQADLTDNVVFASGIAKTQQNIAFTVGFTYAFGTGTRIHPVHYWPATPSMGTKW
jgi:hypothetical protein